MESLKRELEAFKKENAKLKEMMGKKHKIKKEGRKDEWFKPILKINGIDKFERSGIKQFKFKKEIKKGSNNYNKIVKDALKSFYNDSISGFYELVSFRYNFTHNDMKKLDGFLTKYFMGYKILFEFTLEDDSELTLTWTQNSKEEIKELFIRRYFEENVDEIYKSNSIRHALQIGFKQVIIRRQVKTKPPKGKLFKKDGKFFKYINTTDIDLTRYQIIREDDDRGLLDEHCLIYSLKLLGITEDILNNIKLNFRTSTNFPKKNLKEVSDMINKCIVLHEIKNTENKASSTTYGRDKEETIDLVLFEEHYFVFDKKTAYTSYSLKHYNDIKNINDWMNIIQKREDVYEKSANDRYKVNSLQLIKTLFDNKLFSEDSTILRTINDYQKTKQNLLDIPLTNIANEQREIEINEKKERAYDIFYADLETNVKGDYHECILAAVKKEEDIGVKIFKNKDLDSRLALSLMLNYIVDSASKGTEIIVYMHNLKYDFNVFKKMCRHIDICEKEGQIYSNKISHKGRSITFKDSFKLIPKALREFNHMFQLDKNLDKKEAIGYSYYDHYNMQDDKAIIKEYLKSVKKIDRERFMENIRMKNNNGKYAFDYDETNNTFNHVKYYKYYLKYDILVLEAGIKKMGEIIKILTNLDIHSFLTISSLTNHYMKINGAFNGLYEVQGNLREYLSRAIYGGRVELNKKYVKKKITTGISDYDAVSLYPSAIMRMCSEIGLPKGEAKRITTKVKKELDELSYYIVTVKITKIKKNQQIPFIRSYVNDKCYYLNELKNNEPIYVVIDKITLEDYIEFHDIEYEIIDGIYYNEGFNKVMGELIKHLFEERIRFKKEGNNAMQEIIKLMLNSSYGKTIMKKAKTKKYIVDNDKLGQYITNHFNNIVSCTKLSDQQTSVIKDCYDDSYNLSQVGILILSYSKRIMNEVMNIANDNEIVIYYQDTDSMHMNRDDVKKLETLYETKYGKILNGKNMGQFHTDFEIKGACSEVYSTMSYFLGKKCYMDKLESTDKDGNLIHKYHLRMKGITEAGLEHSQIFFQSYEALYDYLSKDCEFNFLLNPPTEKVLFEYSNAGVKTRDSFYRKVNFRG